MKQLKTVVYRIISIVVACGLFISTNQVQAAGENLVGQWITLPSPIPINPIHVANLNNGKVLIVAGSEYNPESKRKRAGIWDPVLDPNAVNISVRDIDWDLFCNAMSHLPDGRVAIVGGTGYYDPKFTGINDTIIYDPIADTFTQGPYMAEPRWYPTNTVLGDGRTLTISGLDDEGVTSRLTEILDASASSWSPPVTLNFTPALYPRGHLLPNGKIFYSAPNYGTRLHDPDTGLGSNIAAHVYTGFRLYGSAVLLPLTPPYDTASILVMGGNNPATNSVERITLKAPDFKAGAKWMDDTFMTYARIQPNATILPNGQILVTGGSSKDKDATTATKAAELYTPPAVATDKGQWLPLAQAQYARLYHSVALLLPDGTVWTAGSNPTRGNYERIMEIYKPPYLFTTDSLGRVIAARRPVINSAPSIINYRVGPNDTFNVRTSNSNDIAFVHLIRLGAVTHAFDMDQRLVRLNFSKIDSRWISVQAPSADSTGHNVAPPGDYFLFIINLRGVPSVAKVVNIR